jgi:SAM-dependent methyltransferase
LAERLIERLQTGAETRVLDFATGSGRNARALRAAGFTVVTLDDATAESDSPFAGIAQDFAAILSTHGLLHGTPASIGARVREAVRHLAPGGVLYATFGSTRDARFGVGRRIDASTYAPLDGDERGVAHAYFQRVEIGALLAPLVEIESLEEHVVDRIAGSWAHRRRPLAGAAHWFAIARKR